MAYLTSQMRAIIRAQTLAQMTDTCTIERLADSVGSLGQVQDAWVIVSTGTACRLITSKSLSQGQTSVMADRITMEDSYLISLPVGTVLNADYRITIGAAVFRVASVLDGRTDSADVQAILIRMRQDG